MNKFYLRAGCFASISLMLAGCVDDNYDLDDIDTTTRITVNNLTVPLNLKPIVLDNVLDLDDNENISVIEVNGEKSYAIEKKGTIETKAVSINPIRVKSPSINPTSVTLTGVPSVNAIAKREVSQDILDKLAITYNVNKEMATSFSFESPNVDPALLSVTSVKSVEPINLEIKMKIPQWVADMVSKITFKDVKLQLPKGLMYGATEAARCNMGTYNPTTGLLTINNEVSLNGNRVVSIVLTAKRLDAVAAGVNIENHTFNYSGTLKMLAEGSISLTPNGQVSLPTSLELTADYSISPFYVGAFSGRVDYAMKGITINPIDLTSLPDFLNDPETNISLGNPQVYFGAINTTADYKMALTGELSLNSVFRNGEQSTAVSPTFRIGYERGVTRYNVAMSANGTFELTGNGNPFAGATEYSFGALSNILQSPTLAGGLPKEINIALQGLHFAGDVVDFPVKNGPNTTEGELSAVTGEYTFYAPLAFKAGSQVVYHKKQSDFGTEDSKKLNINHLTLTAHARTDIPFIVKISVVPLNEAGEVIGVCTQSIVLEPNSDQDIVLIVTGLDGKPISNLDSMDFQATVMAPDNEKPLRPDQTISLSDLRMTVDGYYDTDF